MGSVNRQTRMSWRQLEALARRMAMGGTSMGPESRHTIIN
jgi:hypothetical protein